MPERTEAQQGLEAGCHWPECGEPVADERPGGLCGHHAEWWDHVSEAEAWGMALDTVEHLARAVHAGLGLQQLDGAMQAAVERARSERGYHETERDRLAKGGTE
ncbi:MAG: hypothetical protein H0U55_02065 [Rubrobacteraceae bacterium]|nr:hypothetical protein [Rubrobacteraceae bacterium]